MYFLVKILKRKQDFRIFPVQPRTSTEKQKVAPIPDAPFWFSVEVRGYTGNIRKSHFRFMILVLFLTYFN